MMSDKKVSIVLPVYNGARYVSDSIKSVINQTYTNWELIIVNDCSTDDTLAICEKIAETDGRIRVISNENNLKLPKTLNVGFEHVTGYYYTWTSDDNMYKPEAIETMVSFLENNSEVSMVYADYTNIDADGKIIGEEKLQEPEYIVTRNIYGACFLYTAEIAGKAGRYDENLFLVEDYEYWMRIYRYGVVVHMPQSLYYYRQHGASLTATKKAYVQEQIYKAMEKNFLPLYTDAVKHNLQYSFMDIMLIRAKAHQEETKAMLLQIDKGYKRYLNRKMLKQKVKNVLLKLKA